MSRESQNEDRNARLINGYDYENQAWVLDGCYQRCGHRPDFNCRCYGRLHEAEQTIPERQEASA